MYHELSSGRNCSFVIDKSLFVIDKRLSVIDKRSSVIDKRLFVIDNRQSVSYYPSFSLLAIHFSLTGATSPLNLSL